MTLDAVQVPCPDCRLSSPPTSPGLGYWECPGCNRSFFLRRCRACKSVSHVGAQQSWHHRWQSVSAGAVGTVDLQGVPGNLTIVGSTGGTVRLTGKLRWTGARPAQAHTTVDRAAHLLRLSYRCAAGSPCTENYRLVVPARTAVILSQPSGQVLLDNLAGPLRITAANVNVTATGLRSPSLAATITSGQLTGSFAAPPQQVSITLTSAHAVVRLPASASYTVSAQANSGSVQVGVPQAAHSGHLVTARLDSSDLQLQPT